MSQTSETDSDSSDSDSRLCSQSSLSFSSERPATARAACDTSKSFASMSSPRHCAARSPVSKSQTSAKVSAAKSPNDKPAQARHRCSAVGLLSRSFSTEATCAKYITGWQNCVCSNQPLNLELRNLI